ncbi:uncharacterized protein K452DRAFT_319107 [Aplosporella prunicola CBS 121167]|uniref:Uncharacterized protein n=1 Tax=Aplosporella prunicola CBS 121167 TaxID=1176127 RepID=A0A6A6BDQ6_9PEZI|nr:uncharacterized protein K452DRAFT_319107 [Aplosporella prunicola CBS 121167]KAF2141513.1 hypothetical protein K452DRAFT_319107 [Aplosporella prunicola CBS 121167]
MEVLGKLHSMFWDVGIYTAKSSVAYIIWEIATLQGFRTTFVRLQPKYGVLRAFMLLFLFPDAAGFIECIERHVLDEKDEVEMRMKECTSERIQYRYDNIPLDVEEAYMMSEHVRQLNVNDGKASQKTASNEVLVDANHELSPQKPNSISLKLRTLVRTLKLNALYPILAGRLGKRLQEEPKIAMFKSRTQVGITTLIHFIPVGAAVALIFLNVHEFYIGGELSGESGQDDQKLAALQFAAKLHELLMISSLTATLFTFIRREVTTGDGLPFGALIAGLRIQSISVIWSQEMVGAMRHKWNNKAKKYKIIGLLLISALLGVSVGPSTAQLMRPSLNSWPAGGTTLWLNRTRADLFPQVLDITPQIAHCNVDTGDKSCPHGGWEAIDSGYCPYLRKLKPRASVPHDLLFDGSLSQRSVWTVIRSPNPDLQIIWPEAFTRASTPVAAVADGVAEIIRFWTYASIIIDRQKRFWTRKDAKASITAPQVVVATRCLRQDLGLSPLDEQFIRYPNLQNLTTNPPGGNPAKLESILSEWVVDDNVSSMIRQEILPSIRSPDLLWFDTLDGTNATLQAVAIFPPKEESLNSSAVYSCSIVSRYIEATTNSKRFVYKISYSDDWPNSMREGILRSSFPKITPRAAWARLLNPTINAINETAFGRMAKTAGLWDSTESPDEAFNEVMVESMLTLMVLNGISRVRYNTTMTGTAKGSNEVATGLENDLPTAFLKEFLPKSSLGYGGHAFELTATEQEHATKFTAHVVVEGYAYNRRSATQIAAMAVLLLYCIMALYHVLYTIKTGQTSNSWDTTPEVVALAMNSTRSEVLKNTGAGINTTEAFEHSVKIKSVGQRLEIVFDDTVDITDMRHDDVEANKFYG